MCVTRRSDSVHQLTHWRQHRTSGLIARYRPLGVAAEPLPGTLEHFLTERYCPYNIGNRSRAYRLEIHHPPWKLQRAEAEIDLNTMAAAKIRTWWRGAPTTLEPE